VTRVGEFFFENALRALDTQCGACYVGISEDKATWFVDHVGLLVCRDAGGL